MLILCVACTGETHVSLLFPSLSSFPSPPYTAAYFFYCFCFAASHLFDLRLIYRGSLLLKRGVGVCPSLDNFAWSATTI